MNQINPISLTVAAWAMLTVGACSTTGNTLYRQTTQAERAAVMADIAKQYGVPQIQEPIMVEAPSLEHFAYTYMLEGQPVVLYRDKNELPLHVFYHEMVHAYQATYDIPAPYKCKAPREVDAWRMSYDWCQRNKIYCPLKADDWRKEAGCE